MFHYFFLLNLLKHFIKKPRDNFKYAGVLFEKSNHPKINLQWINTLHPYHN
jgi:hypothetical protein